MPLSRFHGGMYPRDALHTCYLPWPCPLFLSFVPLCSNWCFYDTRRGEEGSRSLWRDTVYYFYLHLYTDHRITQGLWVYSHHHLRHIYSQVQGLSYVTQGWNVSIITSLSLSIYISIYLSTYLSLTSTYAEGSNVWFLRRVFKHHNSVACKGLGQHARFS